MTTPPRRLIEGRLRLELRDPCGRVIAQRAVRNTVMRSGAELIASLFNGSATTPVNGVAVGLDPTPAEPPYEATELTTTATDGEVLLTQAAATLSADAITTEIDDVEFRVRLIVNATMPAGQAVSPDDDVESVDIGEAALGVLAGDGNSLSQIYNRVVFEPIPKRRNQDLAFYWEVDFPYGR